MLATLLNYMDRQVLPQIATELKDQYGLDNARYGRVARNFAWAFAAGSVLFGFVADRIGPRLLYPVVLVGWSAAGLATPLMANPEFTRHLEDPSDPGSGPYRWLLLCRTVLGLFEAGHWPCALLAARQVLTATDRPLGNGLLQSGASLGAILVPFYVMGVRHLGGGWNVAFWTIAGAGLLWVPLWLALVRRGDLDRGPVTTETAPPAAFDAGRFVRVYATLFAVILGITVSWQFIREWLPKYLKESRGYSADAADAIVPFYYVSADLGCLASGVLVRWLVGRGSRVQAARIAAYAAFAVLTAAAALAPGADGWLGVGLLIVAGAGILGLHPLYYALSQELPARHMALLSGLLAAAGWVAAGAVQEAMGDLIQRTGRFDAGFVLAGLAPLAGLVALVVLWRPEAQTKSSDRITGST
ncbi:MAG: MFS transporter [Gemmataceae bacterium]|nr:MFS transporter [Gemmataceae bacterium]